MKVELVCNTSDLLRLMYAQARGTTTSKGFAAVYREPVRFFPKAVKQKRGELLLAEVAHPNLNSILEDFDRAEMQRLVVETLEARHWSVARGVTFSFSFEVSRSTGRQMLRHVVGVSWEEMSQRYVKLADERILYRLENAMSHPRTPENFGVARTLFEQFFEIPAHVDEDLQRGYDWLNLRLDEVRRYVAEIRAGIPPEDARENLPNCTKTQMIGTFGMEALHNLMGKRLCTRAQAPFREVAKAMRREVLRQYPWLGRFMVPHCLPLGICPEANPGTCPLLASNGGTVLRREEAAVVIRDEARRMREERSSEPGKG